MEDNKLITELSSLAKQINGLNEEIPAQLARQIELLCRQQMIMGKLHASSVYDYGKAEADRKMAEGIIVQNTTGTVVEKEAAAKLGSNKARELEAKAESEMIRWKNAIHAQDNLIQAKKKTLDILRVELGGAS